ncbi:TraR/DksA C4-type zinc finger protein [Klebsiella pneumoniae]
MALARQPVRASATNCEECGTEIPEGRRTAQPGVLLCVDCKCIQERMNRR